MLKTKQVYLLCLFVVLQIFQRIQAEENEQDYKAPEEPVEPPEHAEPDSPNHPPQYEENAPPAGENQAAEPAQQPQGPDHTSPGEYNPEDGQSITQSPFSGVTSTDDKKLTPELIEKFTKPLLENRWKWDYRREALVKNFWFASFNEHSYRRFGNFTTLVPLTNDEEQEHVLPLIKRGWLRDRTRNSLKKDFHFQSFYGAFSFMTQIALLSEKIGHFPDWYNVNKKVKVTLSSRSVKGLSMKDILLAKFADKAFSSQRFL